jgi:hypothetical protein
MGDIDIGHGSRSGGGVSPARTVSRRAAPATVSSRLPSLVLTVPGQAERDVATLSLLWRVLAGQTAAWITDGPAKKLVIAGRLGSAGTAAESSAQPSRRATGVRSSPVSLDEPAGCGRCPPRFRAQRPTRRCRRCGRCRRSSGQLQRSGCGMTVSHSAQRPVAACSRGSRTVTVAFKKPKNGGLLLVQQQFNKEPTGTARATRPSCRAGP